MKKLTTNQFIEKASKIHSGKFNYSKVDYINSRTKITIICPIHGDFEQKGNSHLLGIGCPYCGNTKKLSWEDVLSKANIKHSNEFLYIKPIGKFNNKSIISIICKEHGEFNQQISNHLNGSKCPKCVGKFKYDKNHFVRQATKIHGYKYDYSKVILNNVRDTITIICPTHGTFTQKAYIHLDGSGCQKCGILLTGWNRSSYKNIPTILYLIKIDNVYKIGITKSSIKERYYRENINYSVEFQATFLDGIDAYNLEKIILKQFNKYKYRGSKVLKHSGNTEVLTVSPITKIQLIIKEYYGK